MNKILITYASRTGSTAGVAEAIGRALTKAGLLIDVYPVQEVKDLAEYQAIVIGSAIQSAQWLPEAIEFVQKHQTVLTSKPVAIYSVCMTLAMKNGEKYRNGVEKWIDPVRIMAHPVSEGLFTGILDIARIPSLGQRIKFRISVWTGVWKEGDHRDWNAINTWADNLKEYLFN